MTEDCLFCGIVEGRVSATIVYEDESVLAFRDINPVAPHHVLIVPKEHIQDVRDPIPQHVANELFKAARLIGEELDADGLGYRLVFNVGPHAGNTVPHLHMHFISGRQMAWPPG